MSDTLEKVDWDAELSILLGEDAPITCDSNLCRDRMKPSHPAHWEVAASCGHVFHWCNERLSRYKARFASGQFPFCSLCSNLSERDLVLFYVVAHTPI